MHEHSGDLTGGLLDSLVHAVGISLFVFLMMIAVDYLNVWTEGRLTGVLRQGKMRQILIAALLGAAPGCLGSFLVVTLYIRGMLGFGALVACMVASSGDAAFVMMATIPGAFLTLTGLLFVLGVVCGLLSDWLGARVGLVPCAACATGDHHIEARTCVCWPAGGVVAQWRRPRPLRLGYTVLALVAAAAVLVGWLGPQEWEWTRFAILALLAFGLFAALTVPDEYLREHVWGHITRRHLPRVFAWTAGTLLLMALLEHYFDLRAGLSGQAGWMLLAAGGIGLLPDSGPQLVFTFLYAQGAVPFAVLLTSSIVQDGHGMLPLLSVSVRDSLLVKLVNLVFGLAIGALALVLLS